MNIFVTDGAGYIGSVVVEELIRDGHEVTVYDNLSKGHRESVPQDIKFVEAELFDSEPLSTTLRQRKIAAVIHMPPILWLENPLNNPATITRVTVV